MFSALLIAAIVQLSGDSPRELGPSLPPGSNAEVHRAFNLIEEDLDNGRFNEAKAKLSLLPNPTITYSWNDQNVPAAARNEWEAVRREAFDTISKRIPGVKFKADSKPAIKFTFEKSLAKDPESGLPRGIALFFSDDPAETRLEAVIGVTRGNPTEQTNRTSLYNEIVFAVCSYLGLGASPFPGQAMGRLDMQMQQQNAIGVVELNMANNIGLAAKWLKSAVDQKKRVVPAKPKAAFNPTVIERGPVIQGTPLNFSVQVTNTGNAPLHFRLIPDCGCITAGNPPVAAPGATVPVSITVDTSGIVKELSKHLILISNDGEQHMQKFPITIKTTPRYRFLTDDPSVLIVGDQGLDTDLFLALPQDKPLKITSIEVAGNPGSATFEPWQGEKADPEFNEGVKPRTGFRIKVHLDEPQVSGRSAATIMVKTNDPTFPLLRYTYFAQKGIAALPASIFYGDLGKAPREASLILTRPNKPFKVLKVESDSAAVTAEAVAVPGRGGWEYKVLCRYNGSAPLGDFLSTVTVHTDDPKQAKIRIRVSGVVR